MNTTSHHHRVTPRRRPAAILEVLLWIVAAVTLGTGIWMKADAFHFQRASRAALDQHVNEASITERAVAGHGEPIANLDVPRLGLSVVVANGASTDVLRHAAGRLESSAWPGEPGNIVIAAHRDTFFRPLQDIRVGDIVVLESAAGERTYQVDWTKVVDPDETSVLEPSREFELTLITCYPFRYIGNAPKRFVVRASAFDITQPAPISEDRPHYRSRGSNGTAARIRTLHRVRESRYRNLDAGGGPGPGVNGGRHARPPDTRLAQAVPLAARPGVL